MTKKRVALVTGASSGIGEASARKLLAAGYTVYGTSRRGSLAEKHSFPLLTLDVTDDVSVGATGRSYLPYLSSSSWGLPFYSATDRPRKISLTNATG